MDDNNFGSRKLEDLSDRERNELIQYLSDLSQRGYQLLKENYVSEAERLFNEILTHDPDNNYALVGLGDAARKRRAYRDATDYYRRCLAVHPENNYALFGLADCYKALRQYNRAIEVWERYLTFDDQNVTVLTRVADAYRKVRNLRRSREIYLKALEVEKDNPYALIGLGHLLYEFREFEEALTYWHRVFELDGPRVDIRVLTAIGNCHRKMKTYSDGVFYFEKALEREPNNFYALFGLADCYRGMNVPERSLEYWNRILRMDSKNKVILTRAGDAYRTMGDMEKAEEYYRAALNIEYDIYAVLGLGLINKERGNLDDAITAIEQVVQSDPKNPRLYLELADCYVVAGARQKAIEVLGRFQQYGAKNPSIQDKLSQLRRR